MLPNIVSRISVIAAAVLLAFSLLPGGASGDRSHSMPGTTLQPEVIPARMMEVAQRLTMVQAAPDLAPGSRTGSGSGSGTEPEVTAAEEPERAVAAQPLQREYWAFGDAGKTVTSVGSTADSLEARSRQIILFNIHQPQPPSAALAAPFLPWERASPPHGRSGQRERCWYDGSGRDHVGHLIGQYRSTVGTGLASSTSGTPVSGVTGLTGSVVNSTGQLVSNTGTGLTNTLPQSCGSSGNNRYPRSGKTLGGVQGVTQSAPHHLGHCQRLADASRKHRERRRHQR